MMNSQKKYSVRQQLTITFWALDGFYFYLSICSVNMIAHIDIPMFFIGSDDDPVIKFTN